MGCELNPRIPYTEFSVIIKKQKEVKNDFPQKIYTNQVLFLITSLAKLLRS